MPPQLTAQFKRLGAAAASLTLGQKVIAVIGVAVLILGGTAFTKWVSAPTYSPAFTNLASSDANSINDLLTKNSIPSQLADGGSTIMVPQADVATARLKAAGANLPASSATGYSLLDKQGVTTSEFQQQVTYQRALEGELEKTIEGIDGVSAAVVHLAIPEQTVFTDKAGKPTASVLVDTASGASLSDSQVQAIVHLVSSSVPNMDANQVTVSDGKGNLLSAAGQGVTGVGGSDAQTQTYDQNTAASVQAMLDRVLGPGNAVASVNAVLNYDQSQETSETFSTTQGVVPLSQSTSKETYTGSAAGSAAGTLGQNTTGSSGTIVTGTNGTTGGSGYTKESGTQDNAVNKVTKQVVAAPGSVTRQSVAVVVDSAAVAKAGLPQLTQMVSAAAGIDTVRGDTLSVTQATFDNSAAKAAKAQLAQEKAAMAASAQMKLIKQASIAAVVLIALVILFIMWRRSAKKVRRESVDLGELERLYPAPGPVVPHEDLALPVSSDLAPPAPDPAALRRAEVGELVDAQPAEVADLLRGWILEGAN